MDYIIAAWVHAANLFDAKAARCLLIYAGEIVGFTRILRPKAPMPVRIRRNGLPNATDGHRKWSRSRGVRGFHVLPRRRVAERIFAWLDRSRRLRNDDERNPKPSEAQVPVASVRLLIRQLTDKRISYKPTTRQ
jgi:putative transposase